MNTTVAPVLKSIEVSCDPQHAFDTFTAGIDAWWPKADYSVYGERSARAVLEARVGGRLFEVADDGTEAVWGTVLACEPPHRLVFSWHAGTDPASPTEVELRFVAIEAGTRVELEHRNWDRLGDKAQSFRDGYDGGWIAVLAAFEAAV